MKLITLLTLTLLSTAATAFDGQDAYGPGVHADRYGRAYELDAGDGSGTVHGDVDINGYGPGVHKDQYGRPVTAREFGTGRDLGPLDIEDDEYR
jgi:hypothetical protein